MANTKPRQRGFVFALIFITTPHRHTAFYIPVFCKEGVPGTNGAAAGQFGKIISNYLPRSAGTPSLEKKETPHTTQPVAFMGENP